MVSIFLSFLFGSEEGLGYDPAVRRCSGTPIYYEYQISGEHVERYYRTRGALSSFQTLGITGRTTRVWRAVQISGFGGAILHGKEVALKDVWLDIDAHTEGRIQREIFDAVDSERRKHKEKRESRLDLIKTWYPSIRGDVFDIVYSGDYRKYFLEIVFDGQGVSTKDKPLDARQTSGLSTEKEGNLKSRSTGSQVRSFGLKSKVTFDGGTCRQRRHLPKRRYLLIFNDICTALHDATDLKASFLALVDASIGKLCIYCVWILSDKVQMTSACRYVRR